MRGRFVALRWSVATVVALTGLTAAPAAAEPYLLTVTGTGATAADVEIAKTLTFEYPHTVVRGSGRYAGFVIARSGTPHSVVGGVLTSRDVDGQYRPVTLGVVVGFAHLPMVRGVFTLTPGRYRFYLLADGDAEIRAPLVGGNPEGLTVRTTIPYRRTYDTAQVARTADATKADLRMAAPLAPRSFRVVFATFNPRAGEHVGGHARDVFLRACFTRRRAECTYGHTVQLRSNEIGMAAIVGLGTVTGTRLDSRQRLLREARADVSFDSDFASTLTLVVLTLDLS